MVGFGQYPITVLDHANGVATFANDGVYNKAHFVLKVEKQNPDTGKWDKVSAARSSTAERRIDKDIVADVTVGAEGEPGAGQPQARRRPAGRRQDRHLGTQ